jgi:tRNA 5-methylaminomethyl-2-thiouridine biosynthesis bifunctional protein
MLSPHVTQAPTPLSRLSEWGVADMRAELQRLLPPGQGWQACEVDNRGHNPGRWPAALVRPAALVQAWLHEAQQRVGLSTRWNTAVTRLQRTDSHTPSWQALDSSGHLLVQAPVVVVASAWGSLALLRASFAELDDNTLPLRPVKGQMSLGALDGPPLAPRPQRDNGVFVPAYEDAGLAPTWPTRVWAMGSTYRRGDASTHLNPEDHERNAQSLEALQPQAAQAMRVAAEQGHLLGWAQVRCASLDRLPLVGAVPDIATLQQQATTRRRGRLTLQDIPRHEGLYMLAALGSRGLTLSHGCAGLLAAQLDGELLDGIDPDLVQVLDPARFVWRQARKQPVPDALQRPRSKASNSL